MENHASRATTIRRPALAAPQVRPAGLMLAVLLLGQFMCIIDVQAAGRC